MCRKSHAKRAAGPILAAAFAAAAARATTTRIPHPTADAALPPAYSPTDLTARGVETLPISISELERDLKDTHLEPNYDNREPQPFVDEDLLINPAQLPTYMQPQYQHVSNQGPRGCGSGCGRRGCGTCNNGRAAGCAGSCKHGCHNCRSRRRSGCSRPGSPGVGVGIARTEAMVDAYHAEPLQHDLQTFNVAMVDVRAGKCCSKGRAKRAVRQLKKHLVEVEAGRRSGKGGLDRRMKKELKAEAKEVAAVFMREIREAWRAAR